jgi:hypothetical protein
MAYFFISDVDSWFIGYAFLAPQRTGVILKQDVIHYWVNFSFSVARKGNCYLLDPWYSERLVKYFSTIAWSAA